MQEIFRGRWPTVTLSFSKSVVKVVSICFHNRAFLLCMNPKQSNKCDNHIHRITFCIPPFDQDFVIHYSTQYSVKDQYYALSILYYYVHNIRCVGDM